MYAFRPVALPPVTSRVVSDAEELLQPPVHHAVVELGAEPGLFEKALFHFFAEAQAPPLNLIVDFLHEFFVRSLR